MKKIYLQSTPLIAAIFVSSGLFAQDPKIGKIRELYPNGNLLTFNNFGLQYKSELNNRNFFRIGSNKIKHIETDGSLNLDNQSARVSLIFHWNKDQAPVTASD
jgi:hypothetical protein